MSESFHGPTHKMLTGALRRRRCRGTRTLSESAAASGEKRRGDETPAKLQARAQLLGSVCELLASPRRRDAAGGVLEIRNSRSYRNACSFVGVAKTTRRRCSASHPAVESVPVGWDMRSWLLGNAFPLARKCVPTGWDMRSYWLRNAFLLAGKCVPTGWDMRSRWLGNAFLLAGKCVHSRARSRSLRTNASARAHKHTRTHTHTGAGGRRGGLLPHFALGRLSSAGVAPRARALRVCVCVRASVYCRNVEVLLSKKIRSRRSSLRLEQDAITRSVRACARVEH